MHLNPFLPLLYYSLWQSALVIFVFMSLFFLYALLKRRNDIADVALGLGFIAVVWTNVIALSAYSFHVLLVAGAVTLWGLRLSAHIFMRAKDKEEDARYAGWRKSWGKWFALRSYFQIFMLQGFLMLCISVPAIALISMTATVDTLLTAPETFRSFAFIMGSAALGAISWLTILGALAWIKGFGYETVGDYQLMKFLKDPSNKGRIMTKGLWSFTRHPNYFGEVVLWWGIYAMALPGSFLLLKMTWPIWIFALIGPLTITFLILKISGIPMTEKRYEGNAEFEAYKKNTSAFFPQYRKKRSS